MPAPETRLALANLGAMTRGRVLAVGVEPELGSRLPGGSTVFQYDLRAARACAGLPDVRFGAWLDAPDRYGSAIVVLPKEAERLRMLLSMAAPLLEPGALLSVVGRNDAGIRSAGPALAQAAGGEARVVDFRYHCRALATVVGRPPEPSSLARWAASFAVEAAGRALEVVSYPGVFAHGRLDPGTRMLLEALDVPEGARALDVGCGSGVVGAWLARGGAGVDFADSDACAVAATDATLGANGLQGHAVASDVYSDVRGPYDHIVTNAPFHAGTRTSPAVAQRLIRDAPAHLGGNGQLWLVASRPLRAARELDRAFARVEIVREDRRYRVYRARRA